MAELITLARPYAKAAFGCARDNKDLQGWSEALTLAATVTAQDKVATLLSSPGLTSEEKTRALVETCGDTFNDKQQNFISILAENGRLPLLPQVQQLFELYKANQEKSVDVTIQSAYKIDGDMESKLAKALTEKLDRKVSLQTSVDESLLGGAVIRAGDTVIDGSVRGKLVKLAEAMHG
ncbi:F0F1 ATP synthase subunit delta [Teredinibacter haidensis]|uniref:F0F1 ATP synthase subunit delta n=1 Tax=Teredinibacter haidensis TaxID=2731755 RepID=UPI000948A3FD|nr:F0F1 ATP synthase subunit delta [Teredinibacter haidensis]